MYWLCALPLLDSKDRTWNLLQQKTTYDTDMSINYRFELPELRIGTLDSLMVLSDDLVKVNGLMEAVVNKIRRQLFEMQTLTANEDKDPQEVLVEGMPPDNYLERFSWDEAKYPPRRPLQETISTLTETVQRLEDDLKVTHLLSAECPAVKNRIYHDDHCCVTVYVCCSGGCYTVLSILMLMCNTLISYTCMYSMCRSESVSTIRSKAKSISNHASRQAVLQCETWQAWSAAKTSSAQRIL